jgi:DnaJ-class molecular chaperone
MEDPLEILGLKPGDTLETARKRRNALYLKIHPDKNPNDKEKFNQVYNAYEELVSNPNLLKVKKAATVDNMLRVMHSVMIEDFYFKKPQKISFKRKVFCKKCKGSGSLLGSNNKCPHCGGAGKIEGTVFSLLGKDPTCPICKGIGVPLENVCTACSGLRYELGIQTVQFTLEPYNYHKKGIILQGVGDQTDDGTFGPVLVVLKILQDSNITLEENYFVVHDKVFPIQKIIGGTKTVKVFGRDVNYRIEERAIDAYTVDKISPTVSQEIRIKFIDKHPLLTRETVALYKKILELETMYEANDGTIQF